MPATTRELLVFIASPSDLPEEREAVRRAADKANVALGGFFEVRLRVEGWEQVMPGLGRPQELINPMVNNCDVFIGLLNRRWGSSTGTHASGFEDGNPRVTLAGQRETPTYGTCRAWATCSPM